MNDTLGQIRRRKSVRVFEDRPIPPEIKREILSAAFEAPTAGCMMLYTILDITDPEIKGTLSETCDHQPFIAKAPLVLIFLADYQRWFEAFRLAGGDPRTPAEGDLLLAYADAVIAAHNTVVAAESLGIGSCYIGDILENGETVRELLHLPDYVVPAAMLVYGYPTQAQQDRRKPARFDPEYIVFENAYRALSPDEHTEMHRRRNEREGREAGDVCSDIRAICDRKYMSGFSLEMSRSAAEYIKKFASGRTSP